MCFVAVARLRPDVQMKMSGWRGRYIALSLHIGAVEIVDHGEQ
jgi:hypothetical protein